MSRAGEPDWGAVAEKFDLWLPHLAPVGEALIEKLQPVPGHRVLDIACGTGEPALTMARRRPDLEIEGVDVAEGMVKAAQAKAEREELSNARFRAMPAEHLAFADASFHRVVCRFGVMLFQDPFQGLKEMHRVLKPEGRVAVAVWGSADSLPSFRWHHEAFRERLPEELHPPLEKVASLSEPGALKRLMEQAGFREVAVESRQVEYRFDSFDHYWNTVEASQVLSQQFQALPEGQLQQVRDEVALMAREYLVDGRLVVPHQFLVASGWKGAE